MGFDEVKVDDRIIEVLKAHGITEMKEIQSKTFPSAANGHDIIGVSQTGSGKTLGFLLPVIQQIIHSDKPFHTLILTPTRELAYQIADVLCIFQELKIRHALLAGGDDFNQQATALHKHPHIIIGTPGRIVKHIEKTKSFHISRIRKLIFDEADRFFEQDFAKELDVISKKLVKKNQTLMFTATMTDRCKNLAKLFMRSPKVYNLSTVAEPVETLKDFFFFVPEKYKLTVLYNYLLENKDLSVMIFVNLCSSSQKIGNTLSKLDFSCEYLHGKMPQTKRIEIMKSFRNGDIKILVSTDLASRGLDVPHVELIINYDLPENAKIYTHRIGRTARAGREGNAVSFVTQYDVEKLQKIEHSLKRKIENQKYENYTNNEEVKLVYEEVNTLFNTDKSFKKH